MQKLEAGTELYSYDLDDFLVVEEVKYSSFNGYFEYVLRHEDDTVETYMLDEILDKNIYIYVMEVESIKDVSVGNKVLTHRQLNVNTLSPEGEEAIYNQGLSSDGEFLKEGIVTVDYVDYSYGFFEAIENSGNLLDDFKQYTANDCRYILEDIDEEDLFIL